MKLFELLDPVPYGYRTEKDDNSVIHSKNNRQIKSKLTLDKLNKLRIMNDVRKLEHEQKLEKISDQYKPAAPAGGLGL